MKKTINIWMQMLGFDKNDPDRGVDRFLDRTGFVPDSVCALLFHSDFVHLHRGMDEEYTLFPDNCAYRAVLRNTERHRQDWTNYELKELIANLKKKGIDFYAGLMGVYMEDRFHHEFLTDHPELRTCRINGPRHLMCLKRFKDGSFYEDFFVEKLVQTLVDYDCAGVHLSDCFCPSEVVYKSDYSTDMVEQFLAHTGLILPSEIAATMGDDSLTAVNTRQSFIWGEKRREWIAFYQWRWAGFFKKVCDAVHAVGKQVWVLGMYCSDPFEAAYVYGFDCKQVMDAGVDCITANILPTSVSYERPGLPYYFHRMHMDLPFLRAQVGERKVLSMLGLHDASEEWSMIDHAPVKVERDAYTMTAFSAQSESGARPGADGLFLCLGDGVARTQWDFIKRRIDVGFEAETVRSYSPMVLWSDHANDAMVDAYIQTRRPSPHKQSFEIFKAGQPFGGALRSEFLTASPEVVFAPNFDMLSKQEQKDLTARRIPWVGTVPAGYDLSDLHPTTAFTDSQSSYPLTVFLCGTEPDEDCKTSLAEAATVSDPAPDRGGEPEAPIVILFEELPFCKLSRGFLAACVAMLKRAAYAVYPVKCNRPMLAQALSDGRERLYLYNEFENAYVTALVESEIPVTDAKIASAFPVLPVKFVNTEEKTGYFDFSKAAKAGNLFQLKLPPDGISIVDIKR